MRHRRPLLIFSLRAVVSATAMAFVDWRPLLVHYHCWRLDRCREPGEAGPWMDALARDVTRPATAEMVVAQMCLDYQWLTLWTWREVFRPQGRPGLLPLGAADPHPQAAGSVRISGREDVSSSRAGDDRAPGA